MQWKYFTESIIKTHNGYNMCRKERKWSALIPGNWMGFSRPWLLSSILSVGVSRSAKISSKWVPGTLKPFPRTWKSVFSTVCKDVAITLSCKDLQLQIPEIQRFGNWRRGQDSDEKRCCHWVPPAEVHCLNWKATVSQKTKEFLFAETL